MSGILDNLEKRSLSSKEVSECLIYKPDFHFSISSRCNVDNFDEYRESFENILFDFFDALSFVRDYRKEIRYTNTETRFIFGFCISFEEHINYIEFARFVRGVLNIKETFAKSINLEYDLFTVFKNNNNIYSKEDCFDARLEVSTFTASEPFQDVLPKMFYYMFGREWFKVDKMRAVCIFPENGASLRNFHQVKVCRKLKDNFI